MNPARTLLCTTGTSLAQGCPSLRGYQQRASSWEEEAPELRGEIRSRLGAMNLDESAGRVQASAELNVLERLEVQPQDEVVLFATDTADGRACAEELAAVIRQRWNPAAVTLERVRDLQVRDAEALRRRGVMNLIRRLTHYLENPQRRYEGGCVLCPNGGFKGVVPFIGVLGMLYHAPVIYVFEFAECLISLPPLPITLAGASFERAMPALSWARQEGVFREDEFYRRVPGFQEDERPWLAALLESDESGLAALSPLIEVLVEREAEAFSLQLSNHASGALEGAKGNERRDIEDHLRKLASPLWRSQHRATKETSDLEFYPTRHNPWRFAGFTRDGVFHLCWFARHNEYERLIPLPSSQRRAFPDDDFREWSPPVETDNGIAEDPCSGLSWEALRTRLKEADSTITDLRAQLERDAGVRKQLQKSLEDSRQQEARKAPRKKKNKAKRPIAPLPPAIQALDDVLRRGMTQSVEEPPPGKF